MTDFVVIVRAGGRDTPLLYSGRIKNAVDGFEAQIERVLASSRYSCGTMVELWVAEYWYDDVGEPLEVWTKGVA